jgi:hypothetical protein
MRLRIRAIIATSRIRAPPHLNLQVQQLGAF